MKNEYAAKDAYKDARVAGQYDQRRFSDLIGRIGHRLDCRALGEALHSWLPRGGRLLDCPCGTGRLFPLWLERAGHVTAADVSPEMLCEAQEREFARDTCSRIDLVETDATSLPFKDEEFDVVCSVRFIGHLPEDVRKRVVAEFARVASRAVIIELTMPSWYSGLRNKLKRLVRRSGNLPNRWDWQTFRREELNQELNALNLTICGIIPKIPFLSDSCFVVIRRRETQTTALSGHSDRNLDNGA